VENVRQIGSVEQDRKKSGREPVHFAYVVVEYAFPMVLVFKELDLMVR